MSRVYSNGDICRRWFRMWKWRSFEAGSFYRAILFFVLLGYPGMRQCFPSPAHAVVVYQTDCVVLLN